MSHAITNDLGQLAGIIAVDVRKFSKHNDVQQEAIVKLLPKVLEAGAVSSVLSAGTVISSGSTPTA
jgi:hypothetical protein